MHRKLSFLKIKYLNICQYVIAIQSNFTIWCYNGFIFKHLLILTFKSLFKGLGRVTENFVIICKRQPNYFENSNPIKKTSNLNIYGTWIQHFWAVVTTVNHRISYQKKLFLNYPARSKSNIDNLQHS